MRAVLISISPKWCEKIISGEKTMEVRKTRPKIETPFKCYIYCTKGKELWGNGTGQTWRGIDPDEDMGEVFRLNPALSRLNGKVIGEFVCDSTKDIYPEYGYINSCVVNDNGYILGKCCLTRNELLDYGRGKILCGWHISELEIYDQPKDLYEYDYPCSRGKQSSDETCKGCKYAFIGSVSKCIFCDRYVSHAPQSWCYVEEVQAAPPPPR